MTITSFYTSDLFLGDRKPKFWNCLIRLKIVFNKVLLKKYKQMLLTSLRTGCMKLVANYAVHIMTICKNRTDRGINVITFCIISELTPKSSSTPYKDFCKAISVFILTRPSMLKGSAGHRLDNTQSGAPQRNTGKAELAGERLLNWSPWEIHGTVMQTTEKLIEVSEMWLGFWVVLHEGFWHGWSRATGKWDRAGSVQRQQGWNSSAQPGRAGGVTAGI